MNNTVFILTAPTNKVQWRCFQSDT